MPRFTALIYVAFTAVVLWVFFSGTPAERSSENKKLRFLSLAWQEQCVQTNKRIVAEWNTLHPELEIEYVQGVWEGVHDYLVTGFETGDLPDIFHYESSYINDFALRGYLADLAPYVTEETKNDIVDVAWSMVTRTNGEIIGVPFLLQPISILYNKDHFDQAGISAPTPEAPWSWDEFRAVAKKLTRDTDGDGRIDKWGSVMGMRNYASGLVELSPSFGGSFLRKEGGKNVIRVGDSERGQLKLLKDLIYVDKTLARASIGKLSTETLPGFFSGQYSMILLMGIWARQQMVENAPKGFRWGMMLIPKAQSQNTGTTTQTLSIPAKCSNIPAAAQFIEFFLSTQNMAELALGDWLIPTRKSCYQLPEFQNHDLYWDLAVAAVSTLTPSPWRGVPGYEEWRKRVAIPLLQEYFADRLSLDEVCNRLEIESNFVLSRYEGRTNKW